MKAIGRGPTSPLPPQRNRAARASATRIACRRVRPAARAVGTLSGDHCRQECVSGCECIPGLYLEEGSCVPREPVSLLPPPTEVPRRGDAAAALQSLVSWKGGVTSAPRQPGNGSWAAKGRRRRRERREKREQEEQEEEQEEGEEEEEDSREHSSVLEGRRKEEKKEEQEEEGGGGRRRREEEKEQQEEVKEGGAGWEEKEEKEKEVTEEEVRREKEEERGGGGEGGGGRGGEGGEGGREEKGEKKEEEKEEEEGGAGREEEEEVAEKEEEEDRCAGECILHAHLHFLTFDGKRYSFRGVLPLHPGAVTVVGRCRGPSFPDVRPSPYPHSLAPFSQDFVDGKIQIEAESEPCGNQGAVSCLRAVTVTVQKTSVQLSFAGSVSVNGREVALPFANAELTVRRASSAFLLLQAFGAHLLWGLEFPAAYITLQPSFAHKVSLGGGRASPSEAFWDRGSPGTRDGGRGW
ncbi:SCO-spondin [Crotalus adamanteus]|uniref:SCO-spondin n=1 Tax=Crotalus adamanteus TaxID=8729 RepID=A0AAW1B234_CROAD